MKIRGLDDVSANTPLFYDTIVPRTATRLLLQSYSNLPSFQRLLWEHIFISDTKEPNDAAKNVHADFVREQTTFCLEHDFTLEQSSTFLSLALFIFGKCLTDAKFKQMRVDKLLGKVLDRHAVHCPPFARDVFAKRHLRPVFARLLEIKEDSILYEMSLTKYVDFNIITQQKLPSIFEYYRNPNPKML